MTSRAPIEDIECWEQYVARLKNVGLAEDKEFNRAVTALAFRRLVELGDGEGHDHMDR